MTVGSFVSTIVRSALILAASVLATVPWGLSDETVYVPALIVMAVIYDCAWRSGDRNLTIVVFGAGIIVDAMSDGPLGYWSFLFLLGYAIALRFASREPLAVWARVWWTFCELAFGLVLVAWIISSLYFFEAVAFYPMLLGAGTVAVLYPFVSLPLGIVEAIWISGGHQVRPIDERLVS